MNIGQKTPSEYTIITTSCIKANERLGKNSERQLKGKGKQSRKFKQKQRKTETGTEE